MKTKKKTRAKVRTKASAKAKAPAPAKKCRYCKKKITGRKKTLRPRVTCGQECLKARRKELHREYMRKPGPKAKNLAFAKEYRERPEIKKKLKQYFSEKIFLCNNFKYLF